MGSLYSFLLKYGAVNIVRVELVVKRETTSSCVRGHGQATTPILLLWNTVVLCGGGAEKKKMTRNQGQNNVNVLFKIKSKRVSIHIIQRGRFYYESRQRKLYVPLQRNDASVSWPWLSILEKKGKRSIGAWNNRGSVGEKITETLVCKKKKDEEETCVCASTYICIRRVGVDTCFFCRYNGKLSHRGTKRGPCSFR